MTVLAWQAAAHNALVIARGARLSPDSMTAFSTTIRTRLTQAVTDNNTVYLNPVPARSSLPPIAGALLAKVTPDLRAWSGNSSRFVCFLSRTLSLVRLDAA